ncbi:NAD-dependent epimerase/dehydratase family protein [Candidatus Neomarinimicrobiota bacterium]
MNTKVLITGGAGFIGSNLAKKLLKMHYDITILDNLSEQVHGTNPESTSPLYRSIKNKVNFIYGDVQNKKDWVKALKDIELVIHFAAETGTGQSMYEISKYCNVNIIGTAVFLDYIINYKHSIKKVIVASSRAVYGEGKYYCQEDGFVFPDERNETDLLNGDFEPVCPHCLKSVSVTPTDENSKLHPSSIYGITKLTQEKMLLSILQPLKIPIVALRYQNVYGPGQSLSNPYTGILSIFSTLIKSNKKINIFEDGLESRDFVYISDVIDATILAIENSAANYQIFNVGSGTSVTVLDVVKKLINLYDISVPFYIRGNFRLGDIRHNLADLSKIKKILGFLPKYSFNQGITIFSEWVNQQKLDKSEYESSLNIMKSKNLLK